MSRPNKKYILVIDQGTTSSRALLVDHAGQIVAINQREFEQIFPRPGWVEHDALEIWSSQYHMAQQVLTENNVSSDEIAAIGITNQRETTIVWDRKTGKPLHNAIVWQDRRTADFCDELKERGLSKAIQITTGLLPDAYFSATKIKWILDNVPGARDKANAGELAFGTVDSWLIWQLTGGQIHATDATNASRTMLYNINNLTWDEKLLELFDIPLSMLPEVKDSSEIYGDTASGIFDGPIPIAGVAGDQQAALFGQLCLKKGMIKNTYGTGCFLMMNTGDKPVLSKNNLLTTLAWVLDGKPTYALEGSIFIGGAVVQWLRDGLKIIDNSQAVETLAASVDDNGGVYVVPAFAGLGAPHWDAHARGLIIGITRGTTDAHIARAALESIAYQSKDVMDAMIADAGITAHELRVDGGASANAALMQFQADILDLATVRPRIMETTAMGAGYLAGLAVGFWPDIKTISTLWQKESTFLPSGDKDQIRKAVSTWKEAVQRSLGWNKE